MPFMYLNKYYYYYYYYYYYLLRSEIMFEMAGWTYALAHRVGVLSNRKFVDNCRIINKLSIKCVNVNLDLKCS